MPMRSPSASAFTSSGSPVGLRTGFAASSLFHTSSVTGSPTSEETGSGSSLVMFFTISCIHAGKMRCRARLLENSLTEKFSSSSVPRP